MSNLKLSRAIKKIRLEKDFSQEKLSEKSGLSLRTVQRLENGKTEPRGDTLKRLVQALELPEDYFDKMKQSKNDFQISTIIKRITIPWYIVGFTSFGTSLGFILGIAFIFLGIIPMTYEYLIPAFIISIASLFGSIGIIIGNTIEKKHNK